MNKIVIHVELDYLTILAFIFRIRASNKRVSDYFKTDSIQDKISFYPYILLQGLQQKYWNKFPRVLQ